MRRRPEQNARVGPNRVDGETARGRGPPPRLSIRHLAVRGPCTAGLVSTRWPGQAVRTASAAESDPGVCGALRCLVPRWSRALAAAAVAASASPPRTGQSWATWAAGHPRLSPGSTVAAVGAPAHQQTGREAAGDRDRARVGQEVCEWKGRAGRRLRGVLRGTGNATAPVVEEEGCAPGPAPGPGDRRLSEAHCARFPAHACGELARGSSRPCSLVRAEGVGGRQPARGPVLRPPLLSPCSRRRRRRCHRRRAICRRTDCSHPPLLGVPRRLPGERPTPAQPAAAAF